MHSLAFVLDARSGDLRASSRNCCPLAEPRPLPWHHLQPLAQFDFQERRPKCVSCLQDNLVDEVADLNTVPNEKQQHDITAGISNSFGFGGHNSVVAFAPFKQ